MCLLFSLANVHYFSTLAILIFRQTSFLVTKSDQVRTQMRTQFIPQNIFVNKCQKHNSGIEAAAAEATQAIETMECDSRVVASQFVTTQLAPNLKAIPSSYHSAAPKYRSFLDNAGFDEKECPTLVDSNGNINQATNDLLTDYAHRLRPLPAMTPHVFSNCIGYAQSSVKIEVNYYKKPAPKGYVRALPEVSKLVCYYKSQLNGRKIEKYGKQKYVDLHAKLENDLTPVQMAEITELGRNNDVRLKCIPLTALNFLHLSVSTQFLCVRSENDRHEYLYCNFIKRVDSVGPKGQIASCVVTNQGKTNFQNIIMSTGCFTHTNALFSLDAIKGAILFFRYKILNETFPSFDNLEEHMDLPALRSPNDRKKTMG